MTNITLPFWIFVILAGAPSLCLLGLVFRVFKNLRKEARTGTDHPIGPMPLDPIENNTFQSNLNILQIDAVFNTLSAIVETERIKLKSLLCPTMTQVSALPMENSEVEPETSKPIPKNKMGISQQISERVAAGESVGTIANALGISCSEVELSISISAGTREEHPARLEAVA